MNTDDDDALMSEAEFAAWVRVGKSTPGLWRNEGRAPTYYRIGKRIVYRRRDVEQWLEQHRKLPRTVADVLAHADELATKFEEYEPTDAPYRSANQGEGLNPNQ